MGNCFAAVWLSALLALLLVGCASRQPFIGERSFEFPEDTFAYANELHWEYRFDEQGNWVHQRREPEPDYAHHCFVVARAARQFFQHARFDPALQRLDDADYRKLIARVVAVDPSKTLSHAERIVIPGFANLREFSEAHEELLKAECGGSWQSYVQRGNWRMIFPFSRENQAGTAETLLEALDQNRPPVVHILRFPKLTINHAVLLFDAKELKDSIEFVAYDPNSPEAPTTLTFNRSAKTFTFPANNYFPGGPVDVYEIYRAWNY